MSGICMACNAKVSTVWIQCPACKTMGSVFPARELTKQSSGTNIPIESQKPPFKSEPYAGYIECLKEKIVELESMVQAMKRCGNCEFWCDPFRYCKVGKFDTCPHNSYADWNLSKYYAKRALEKKP
jgi:hypothetical protein